MRYFISIDYDEPNQDQYEQINCSSTETDDNKIFKSGNFVKDWFDMIKHIIFESDENGDRTFSATFSSSVNHFITDGKAYDSAYLHFGNGKTPYLDYDNVDNGNLEGVEFFVPKGTRPTWLELKEMCKID